MPIVLRGAQAEEDLIQIWSYVAMENPAAADRLLDKMEQKWELVATQPRVGAAREDIGTGIRSIVVGEYLTFYRPIPDGIEVLRVLHGRRDVKRAYFKS
jgi:toxin ParE1/3/4